MEQKKNYKGYEIQLKYDEYPESPQIWESDQSFLVYDHREFTIVKEFFDPQSINNWLQAKSALLSCEEEDKEELEAVVKYHPDFEDYHIYPVYAYIHSGVSLSLGNNSYPFNDRWDVSMRGFILISKEIENHEEAANDLITEWNTYLSGDVYSMRVIKYNVCKECGHVNEEILDACHNYYGRAGAERAIKEGEDFIDSLINKSIN